MSRIHESHKASVVNMETDTLGLLTGECIEEALRICHKGSEGHGWMIRIYLTLCKKYPRTSDLQRVVAEYVADCPECEKIRHSMKDRFKPLLRANFVDHHRQMIGIDGLTITPPDIHGMAYAYVKLVAIYPTRPHTGDIPYTHYDVPIGTMTVIQDVTSLLKELNNTVNGLAKHIEHPWFSDINTMVLRSWIDRSWFSFGPWFAIDSSKTTGVKSRILEQFNSSSMSMSDQRRRQVPSISSLATSTKI